MNWTEFFFMGGYGFYVWGAYGVTLASMAGEVILLLRRRKAARRRNRPLQHIHQVEI
jgi:heme exporter protein D